MTIAHMAQYKLTDRPYWPLLEIQFRSHQWRQTLFLLFCSGTTWISTLLVLVIWEAYTALHRSTYYHAAVPVTCF